MSIIGVLVSLVSCWCRDGATIQANGFLAGYSPLVWTVIFLQATGGLVRIRYIRTKYLKIICIVTKSFAFGLQIVALVVKKADNLVTPTLTRTWNYLTGNLSRNCHYPKL